MRRRSYFRIALPLILVLNASFANAMVFLAPGASLQGYERFLVSTNQQSYTQWLSNKTATEPVTAHEKVVEFSQLLLSQNGPVSEKMRSDWTNLRLAEDLNSEDREILFLLAEKKRQLKEICRLLLLQPSLSERLSNAETLPKCDAESAALPAGFARQFGPRELVQIDGVLFSGDRLPKRLVAGPYRWRIISNTFVDREFIGTVKELAAARLAKAPWVQGTCGSGTLSVADFTTQSQAKLFFSTECVDPALRPAWTFSTWAEDHKTLLWGLGILAVGLTAYQLRDKNVVFTRN